MSQWSETPKYYNTLIPYQVIEHKGIQYTNCRDFHHISRCQSLRQVIHNPSEDDRFIALESPNPFQSKMDVTYYEVPAHEENRLDIIAYKTLGSAQYAWVIAYFNSIDDGFTCREGQTLSIPKNLSSLFNTGELLAPINALQLNLGSE